jgi:hypothetical protein
MRTIFFSAGDMRRFSCNSIPIVCVAADCDDCGGRDGAGLGGLHEVL